MSRRYNNFIIIIAKITIITTANICNLDDLYSAVGNTSYLVGGVPQWLEHRSMNSELFLACAMTCS